MKELQKIKKKSLVVFTLSIFLSSYLKVQAQQYEAPELDQLKINQIQLLGSHNSYALPVDSILLAYADSVTGNMTSNYLNNMSPEQLASFREYHPNPMKLSEALHYQHPDFDAQLNAGLRNLEIDVYYDPQGNRFADPAGYRLLKAKGITDLQPYDAVAMAQPGFKVMHIADLDFRTHYPTFQDALKALKTWSDKHPDHLPLFIQIEAKGSGLPVFADGAKVLPFTAEAYDALDQEILTALGRDKIIEPDDVRRDYATLKDAVIHQNWPSVKAARGKFIFLLLPSTAGLSKQSPYTEKNPNLEHRVMFVQSDPGDSFGAFLLYDNAIVRKNDIKKYVKEGFLIRSRSDIDTYEAKVNDYTRAKATIESGAQIISTDFYQKENTYGNSYRVTLPGGKIAIANPVNGLPEKK